MSTAQNKGRTYHIRIIVPAGSTGAVMYSMDEAGRISAVLQGRGWKTSLEIGLSEPWEDPLAVLVLILRWGGDERSLLIENALNCKTAGVLLQGRMASTCFESILNSYPALSAVVIGESEQTTPEALEALEDNQGLETVAGLAFIRNGRQVRTTARPVITDLDALPWPDRRYLEPTFGFPFPVVPIESSHGCRGRCFFCTSNQFRSDQPGDQRVRMRAPEKVADELADIMKRFAKNLFYFVSDNFFASRDQGRSWAAALADEIARRGLKLHYHMECRADDVEPSLFEALKVSGLKHVYLGLESGSQKALDRYGKGTTVEQNRKAVTVLNSLGIEWSAGFIFYDPCLTWMELGENIEFAAEIKLLEKTQNSASFKGMVAYPGTVWRDSLARQGIDAGAKNYPFQDPRVEVFVRQLWAYEGQLAQWTSKVQQWQRRADRLVDKILKQQNIPSKYKFRARLPEVYDWRSWHAWLKQCRFDEADFMRYLYSAMDAWPAEGGEDGQAKPEAAMPWLGARARTILGQTLTECAKKMDRQLRPAYFTIRYQGQSLSLKQVAA